MKELENAANMKKGNRLSHAGRRGYRALQEITTLKGTEGYQGLSVLVVGPTNPEQLHLSPDGLTIVNADSMIRDQFKAFLRGIDFRKGVFFLTMDKTNASLAAAEGLTALRIQYPRRLRKGDELPMPKEESVLLARLVYELAIEFGTVRVTWEDHGPHARWAGADPGVMGGSKGDVEDLVAHAVHARHGAVGDGRESVSGHEVGAVFRECCQEVRESGRGVREVRVERPYERPGRGRKSGLVRPTVAPPRLGYDPGSFRGCNLPRPISRLRVDDQDFCVPIYERGLNFVDHGADRGRLVHRRDDDGDLGHRRAMLGASHKGFAVREAAASRRTCIRRIRGGRRSVAAETRTSSSAAASAPAGTDSRALRASA